MAATPALSTETIAAANATGRVLRQIVRAERNQPPFDRVMMDGIAVHSRPNSFGHVACCFQVRVLQHENELLTAVAADLITGSCTRDHTCSGDTQHVITDEVAVLVIDLFELVEIRHDYAQGPVVSLRVVELLLQKMP